MVCPNCKKENQEDDIYCIYCGTPLSPDDETATFMEEEINDPDKTAAFIEGTPEIVYCKSRQGPVNTDEKTVLKYMDHTISDSMEDDKSDGKSGHIGILVAILAIVAVLFIVIAVISCIVISRNDKTRYVAPDLQGVVTEDVFYTGIS